MDESKSRFQINFVRDVCLAGKVHFADEIKKVLKGYPFLLVREGMTGEEYRTDAYFLVYAADFTSPQSMQEVARVFANVTSPLVHKIIVLSNDKAPTAAQGLFAQEIGARFFCTGVQRFEQLKSYVRRICVEEHQVGELSQLAGSIADCINRADLVTLRAQAEKLRDLATETEESLRLSVTCATALNEMRRAEVYLKRLLALNPQNLWAANTLGRLYLRSGKVSEGIDILSKLSFFHDLDSERLATLGTALVERGDYAEARNVFQKGLAIAAQGDTRFSEGLAKVSLGEHDYDGAIALLGNRALSSEFVSYLNMRAVMAIKKGQFSDGVSYYQYAIKGAGDEAVLKAKVLFNLGLAQVKQGLFKEAKQTFLESCRLGGQSFQRAKSPLDKVTATLAAQAGSSGAGKVELLHIDDDIEWESFG